MPLMRAAFEAVDFKPAPGSSLDQVHLIDGDEVVEDYIRYGEYGLALDHLRYMIDEPPLSISDEALGRLESAAAAFGV